MSTYFVNLSTGDDNNDGLSLNSSFLTIDKAKSVMAIGDTCTVTQTNNNTNDYVQSFTKIEDGFLMD